MVFLKGQDVVSEGIVLKAWTAREDDLLAEILTPDYGRLVGLARHGRKSRKRFGTVLESFNLIRVRFQSREGVSFLKEAVLEKPWPRLTKSLDRILAAFYLIEIVRKAVHERSPEARIYELLKESLNSLNAGNPSSEVLQSFDTQFLKMSGYDPYLDKCLLCGRLREEGGRFFFVFRQGGVYCPDCLPPGLASEEVSDSKMGWILSRFLEFQIGQPLKTRKFLTEAAFPAIS